MVKKLLKLKIRFFIFALILLGGFTIYANSVAAVNTSFSKLNTNIVVNAANNTSNIYGENIIFSNNLSFVNYLWADNQTAQAGFKKVFQKVEVLLLKEEVLFDLPCPINISVFNDAGLCSAVVSYTTPTTSVSGNTVAQTSGLASGSIFPVGLTTNIFEERDSGNIVVATCSFTVTVADNTAPTLTAGTNQTANTAAGLCTASVAVTDATFGDNCTGSTIAYNLSGATTKTSTAGQVGTFTFNKGVTIIEYTVTDAAGNTTTGSKTVTVTDNINPTLTAGTNQTANTAAGLCTASVAVTDATFGDNCTGSTIAYTLSGDTVKTSTAGQVGTYTFNKGVTTINYTVTDAAGNTTTGSKTVTVTDNEPPTALCQNITVQLDASGEITISASQIDNGSNDACGISLLSLSKTTFTCEDIGPNTVTLSVTDNEGNESTCPATVTVEDVTPPNANCGVITLTLNSYTGEATITDVNALYTSSGDACGIDSIVLAQTVFGCNDIGINYVDLTITDNNGNETVCAVEVTVEAPIITSGTLTGVVVNPSPVPAVPASNLIEVTACPGGIADPKDVQLTLNLDSNSNINPSNISTWQRSTEISPNWVDIPGTSGLTQYTLTNLTTTTFVRLIIQSGDCIETSPVAIMRFLPPDEPPRIVSITNTQICLNESVTIEAESFFDYGGQFGDGGFFNEAQPDGWRVDGIDGFFPASGNNTSEPTWKETNGPTIQGGIRYDTSDNTKFAVAWGPYKTTLETPIFNTIGMTATEAILEFYQAYFFCNGGSGEIKLSLDGGNTYNIILNTEQGDNYTSGNDSGFEVKSNSGSCGSGPNGQQPTSDPFQFASIDLSSYIDMSNLRVKFTFDALGKAQCNNTYFPPAIGNTCGTIPSNFNVYSGWVIDDVGFPYAPIDEELVCTDEDGGIIATGNTVNLTPVTPGIQEYGVTTLVNGCRADTDDGTEYVSINTSLAYAGQDFAPQTGECGQSSITLNAYDNSQTAVQNYNNGAWKAGLYVVPDVGAGDTDYPGTGVIGTWSFLPYTPTSCNAFSPTFSSNLDPRATFTAEPGTYTLRWTLANGCFDDVIVTITSCNNINFDGDDDFVTFKDNYSLNGAFSIETWVKPNSVTGTQTIFSKRLITDTTKGYNLNLEGGIVKFYWYSSFGNGSIDSQYSIGIDRWYHLAVTFDGTNYNIYIDGILLRTVAGIAPEATTGNVECILGALDDSDGSSNTATNNFYGWLDELRIWNVALTDDQLHQMMNQEIKLSGSDDIIGEIVPIVVNGLSWATNLLGYYHMNIGCGYLTPTKGPSGRLRNIDSDQNETAPIPYTSRVDGQPWGTDNTWTHYDVWDAPNSTGVNGDPIDWNIVKISHDISSGNRDIRVLGLLSDTSGKLLTIANPGQPLNENNSGNELFISHYLLLNGNIDLVGESQLVQKRYMPTQFSESIFEPTSSGYIERDQQGQKNSFNYNYWSSPVSPLNNFANNEPYAVRDILKDGTNSASPGIITFGDGAYFADGTLTSPIKISNRWIWSYNSLISASNTDWDNYYQWKFIASYVQLKSGEGFTMKGTGGAADVDELQNYVFVGKPHSGDISLGLAKDGSYLIGNPYPSALDADEFILDNLSGRAGVNVFNGALYFWDHFRRTDNHILAQYAGGYATYTLMGGVPAKSNTPLSVNDGVSGFKKPERYIPVGQAFFVEGTDPDGTGPISVDGGTLVFKNNQRVFKREVVTGLLNNGSIFLKSNTKTKIKEKETDAVTYARIRLVFDSPEGYHRQLLAGVDPNTTNQFDIGFDGPLSEDSKEDMFWQLGSGKLVIQGVNNFDEDQELPLGLKIAKVGLASIKIEDVKNIAENTTLHIKDKFTGKTHNISQRPFEIELAAGTYLDRFSLIFKYQKLMADDLGTDILIVDPIIEDKNYHVFVNNTSEELQIKNNGTDEIRSISLYNYLGQTMNTWNTNLNRRIISLPVKLATGVYMVQINITNGTISKRIIIK